MEFNDNLIDLNQALKKSVAEQANYLQVGGLIQPGRGPVVQGHLYYDATVVSVDTDKEVTIKVTTTRHLRPGDKIGIQQNINY